MAFRVCFVCLGNICRSPMAEAVFRDMVEREGLTGRISVGSAGTGDWHVGHPPHEGTRQVLDRHRISYTGMRAKQLTAMEAQRWDLLVAMDGRNERDIRALLENAGLGAEGDSPEVLRFLSLLPESGQSDVPDPYYTGNFDEVYALVRAGCEKLLAYVKQKAG